MVPLNLTNKQKHTLSKLVTMHRANFFLLITALCFCVIGRSQNVETDSLKRQLAVEKQDEKRVQILEGLSYAYLSSYPDTALQYATQGLQLAEKINYLKGKAICTNAIGNVYFHKGDNAKALEMYLEYLRLKENLRDFNNLSVAYFNIASVYTEEEDYRHALDYLFKAKKEDEKAADTSAILYDNYSLANIYQRMDKADSALFYNSQAYELVTEIDDKNMIGAVLSTFGGIYMTLKDTVQASKYYRLSIPYVEAVKDYEVLASVYFGLAKTYEQKEMHDSSIFYGRKAFAIAYEAPFFKPALETSAFLRDIFKARGRYDSAFHYQQLSADIKDSLFNIEQVKKVQDLKFQEQQRQQAIETERIKFRNTIKLFVAIFVAFIILAIAIALWRSNKEKHKANVLLTAQKATVEATLAELKAAQAQLIQSEKMASLGELTAGIAHEIQNPLNFVNNFSDVNKELIEELKQERNKAQGTRNEQLENDILNNIQENEEKINHHGKRADAIVKGMLQHSRTGSGQTELTDINAIADEYLRLAYHGLRAKDKSFNATFEADLDPLVGKININPQDIGRVLLNLINNAFYAVNEKAKQDIPGYEPTVVVTTKRTADEVFISVTDNGSGIPQKIVDKIFQPFFTTKPTGKGTGLGLSLSYDIVKAHGGEITVESREGVGSDFVITLPGV